MIKYIYIAGIGRSGTTLFEKSLGERLNSLSLGEAGYLIERGYFSNELCGCGVAFNRCAFWSSFRSLIESEFDEGQAYRLTQEISKVESTMGFYWGRHRNLSEPLARYYDLYLDAIREQCGGNGNVIDSSKRPVRFNILHRRRAMGFEFARINFYRHPTAVAYSWTKPKNRIEASERSHQVMRRFGFYESVFKWMNVAIVNTFGNPETSTINVRYEDFVQHPAACIDRVVKELGLVASHNTSPSYHAISGNPCRFSFGEIREDVRWKTAVGGFRKLLVRLLTFPFSGLYRHRNSS
jgi:hypothetical protein